jgi:hypothetical protein
MAKAKMPTNRDFERLDPDKTYMISEYLYGFDMVLCDSPCGIHSCFQA